MLASLGCLTRYVGITLLLVGAVLLLMQRTAFQRRLSTAATFTVFGALPTGLWMVRNYAMTQSLAGGHAPSSDTLGSSALSVMNLVSAWLVSPSQSLGARASVSLGGALLLGIVAFATTHSHRRLRTLATHSMPWLLYCGVYVAYLVFSASTVAIDQIDNRLLSPIYAPMVLGLVGSFDAVVAAMGDARRRRLAQRACVIGTLFCLFPQGQRMAVKVDSAYRNGAGGYSTRFWRESPTVAFVAQLSANATLLSNHPDAIHLLTGRDAKLTPRKHANRSLAGAEYDLRHFREIAIPGSSIYLFWFKNSPRSYLYSVDELRAVTTVEEIRHFSDGDVYRIGSR